MTLVVLRHAVVEPPPPPPPPSGFVEGSDAPGASEVIGQMFGGPDSGCWLTTRLPDNTAIADTSDTFVREIVRQLGTYTPWINTTRFTSTINVVPADQPLVTVNAAGSRLSQSYAVGCKAMLASGVPLPDGLRPTADSDAELVIIQPKSRSKNGLNFEWFMWDLWAVTYSDTAGFAAQWGGRYPNVRNDLRGHWWDDWWTTTVRPEDFASPYGVSTEKAWGAQASKLPLSHSIITRRDVLRGVIDHPIGFSAHGADGYVDPATGLKSEWGGIVWPAQMGDFSSTKLLLQGARFRLPASFVVDPGLPAFTRMVLTAMRDYGLVHTDTATGITFRTEPGAAPLAQGFPSNPATFMRSLPWAQLQQIAVGSDGNQTPVA